MTHSLCDAGSASAASAGVRGAAQLDQLLSAHTWTLRRGSPWLRRRPSAMVSAPPAGQLACPLARLRCCILTGAATSSAQASHPLVTAVEKRVTDLVCEAQKSLSIIDGAASAQPLSFVAAEPLQVVRYTVSQGYCAHFDNRSGSTARKGACEAGTCSDASMIFDVSATRRAVHLLSCGIVTFMVRASLPRRPLHARSFVGFTCCGVRVCTTAAGKLTPPRACAPPGVSE